MKTENTPIFGIPDDQFIRDSVPMSKQEIRMLALGLLDLHPGHQVLEIGSGSGAMTVEIARHTLAGQVWSVDRNQEAIELSRQNLKRFQCNNVTLIHGQMPETMAQLPAVSFNRVFIGGSGGSMPSILEALAPRLEPAGKLVITAMLMETVNHSLQTLTRLAFPHIDFRMVSVYRGRKMGDQHGLHPLTPIYIIDGAKRA